MPLLMETSAALERAPHATEELSFEVQTDDCAALALWRELDLRLRNPFLFCSWDWIDAWVRVFGPSLPHFYFVGRCGGEVVGIALLVEGSFREGLIPIRTLHLGTAGEPVRDSVCVEYNRLLVAPLHAAAFADALRKHLSAEARWDRLHLDGLASDWVPRLVEPGAPQELLRIPSHYFDLRLARDAGRDVLATLGSSTRRNIKQNQRQLGTITLDWSETVDDAEAIFNELIALHQARWTAEGKPGCYASASFTGFHRALLQRLVPQKRMVLARGRTSNGTLGCVQLLVERNRLLLYQCGSARLDSKLSPGLITDYLSMQAGLERGFDAYDFLAGDTVHKRKLSTHAQEVVWATWRRPSWKFRLADALRAVKRRLVRPTPAAPNTPETV